MSGQADVLPWLVVIDHQRIFADPASQWCAPGFARTVPVVRELADRLGDRVLLTRWLPGTDRSGSWADYFAAWPFADRPDQDEVFSLVDSAVGLSGRPTLDVNTFGKWGPELAAVTGEHPHLVLAGVSTDCCVISTALAAADAGCHVTVVSDACAGSDDDNHRAALRVMGLYAPQVRVLDSTAVLAELG